MTTNKRNLFNVTVFDVATAGKFDTIGRLDKINTAVEFSNLPGVDAVALIEAKNDDNLYHLKDMTDKGSADEVVGIRVKLNLGFIAKHDAQSARDDAIKSIKQWAEKSRFPYERGYRGFAVMNGRLEENTSMDYVYTTKVLLSTMLHYDDKTAMAGVEYDDTRMAFELDSLKRGLTETFGYGFDFDLKLTRI